MRPHSGPHALGALSLTLSYAELLSCHRGAEPHPRGRRASPESQYESARYVVRTWMWGAHWSERAQVSAGVIPSPAALPATRRWDLARRPVGRGSASRRPVHVRSSPGAWSQFASRGCERALRSWTPVVNAGFEDDHVLGRTLGARKVSTLPGLLARPVASGSSCWDRCCKCSGGEPRHVVARPMRNAVLGRIPSGALAQKRQSEVQVLVSGSRVTWASSSCAVSPRLTPRADLSRRSGRRVALRADTAGASRELTSGQVPGDPPG